MNLITRILKTSLTIGMIIVVTVGGIVGYVVRSPMPQVAGEVQISGLQNEVNIYRDEWGVPHIYASSAHDLFVAQGYVHAQDRFWQMEFWRRIGSGRLSEMFGKATLSQDLFIRTLGWRRAAEADEAALDTETKQYLQWYADGVNAYIDTHSDLGLEFTIMGLQGADTKPEKWTVINSLTWLKAMAWDLGGNMDDELERAKLNSLLGPEATLELKPPYASDHPVIIPSPAFGFDDSDTLAVAQSITDLLGGGFDGVGSNNWVISGKLTDTGKPYLANDPHLGIQMPSIWYEVGLHCRTIADYCPFDVVGFSFAGVPGVIIGHNQRIAWGVTNLGPDVQDLYIENINPENPNQYEANGAWADAQLVPEIITVRGKVDPDPDHPEWQLSYDEGLNQTTLTITVRITRHGPIVDNVYASPKELSPGGSNPDVPPTAALALRWTAIGDPSMTYRAVINIMRAQNWDQFRNALRDWSVPSQNFVYADIEGNIGYQSPGLIPIRRSGDGTFPVPGWNDDHEWTGWIPFEELPSSYNPPQGYIATANQAVVGPDYPYLITQDWDHGYRAQRINDMIKAKQKIAIADIQAMQGDNANLSAQEVIPFLSTLTFDEPVYQNGLSLLKGWDLQQHMESSPAALYNLFWARLVSNTFFDELGEHTDLRPGTGAPTMVAVRNLLTQPDNHWWDNVTTPDKVETRDDILRDSFKQAYDDGVALLGSDPANWKWGQLHMATFRNQTLGKSGISLIESIFNRGPVWTSGGSSIVNATGYRFATNEDNNLNLANTFTVTNVPSMRMIVDLSGFANSLTMHTTGQSGHPFNGHYDDMIESWRLIKYHPMLWDEATIKSTSKATLTLKP
jgi:penicillin amidase